jgi:hypothetical protein
MFLLHCRLLPKPNNVCRASTRFLGSFSTLILNLEPPDSTFAGRIANRDDILSLVIAPLYGKGSELFVDPTFQQAFIVQKSSELLLPICYSNRILPNLASTVRRMRWVLFNLILLKVLSHRTIVKPFRFRMAMYKACFHRIMQIARLGCHSANEEAEAKQLSLSNGVL